MSPRLVAQDFSPAMPAGRGSLKTCATAILNPPYFAALSVRM
jgi:hypothetical protein